MQDRTQDSKQQSTAEHEKAYIYKSTVKNIHGFSDSWIKALGKPDRLVPNPHYSSGPPSSLYLRKRVEAFIELHADAYSRRLRERHNRSAAAKKAARPKVEERHRREAEIFKWALEVPIHLQELPEDPAALTRIANESFDELALNRDNPKAYTRQLTRAGIVAFVRHERTNYHDLLDELESVPGSWEAYLALKARINAAICSRLGYDFKEVDDGIWRGELKQNQCIEVDTSISAQHDD